MRCELWSLVCHYFIWGSVLGEYLVMKVSDGFSGSAMGSDGDKVGHFGETVNHHQNCIVVFGGWEFNYVIHGYQFPGA